MIRRNRAERGWCRRGLYALLGWMVVLSQGFAGRVEAQDAENMAIRKVAIVVFEGVELLDFAGPAEIFGACTDEEGAKRFEVFTVGGAKRPVQSLGLLSINPKFDPKDAPQADILVIPGGNVMSVMDDPGMLEWIREQHAAGCTILSVCNGASVLAKLGYLDGLQVATHHSNREILEMLAPKATCLSDRRFIDHGKIITTAGVSAGIDGALYLVARLLGTKAAKRSATGAEFDYWIGFQDLKLAIPERDENGLISQRGRVHEADRDWAVFQLLRLVHQQGIEVACREYPSMLEKSSGHDREMIEEAGLTETADWLLQHGRDPNVGLSVLKLIALVHPKSVQAQLKVGEALIQHDKKDEAKPFLRKALELEVGNPKAQSLLRGIEG